MTEEQNRARWAAMSGLVADRMKVFTRPYVNILAGGNGIHTEVGTGTFIENGQVQIITCEHVARLDPRAYTLNASDGTSVQLECGPWRADRNINRDIALSTLEDQEWDKARADSRPLPMSKFAQRHEAVPYELLFFRGIAGKNADYVGSFGVDAIITGYISREEKDSGDNNIFEMLWSPGETVLSPGTDEEVKRRVKYDDPAGFSGSLVWNTRFVEKGCDVNAWCPQDAVVTGLLRRFDPDTQTLLVWRIEHLNEWL